MTIDTPAQPNPTGSKPRDYAVTLAAGRVTWLSPLSLTYVALGAYPLRRLVELTSMELGHATGAPRGQAPALAWPLREVDGEVEWVAALQAAWRALAADDVLMWRVGGWEHGVFVYEVAERLGAWLHARWMADGSWPPRTAVVAQAHHLLAAAQHPVVAMAPDAQPDLFGTPADADASTTSSEG